MSDPILLSHQRSFDARHQADMQAYGGGAVVVGPSNGRAHAMSLDPAAVHVNAPLPNISIMYRNRAMIADDVMPVVRVQKTSDLYWKYDAAMNFYLMKTDVAGQLSQPAQASPGYSTATYSVIFHALRDYVPAAVMANADSPLAPLVDSTVNLNAILRLARENRVATAAFTAGNYGSNTQALTGAARWDTSTGTPITNIQTWIPLCTMYPTRAVIGEQSWIGFMNNPETKSFFTSRPKSALGDTPFFMDDATFAKAMQIDKLLIGRAKYNSAPDGEAASIAPNFIWGKSFALLHIPEAVGVRCAAWGITVRFVGPTQIGGQISTGEFMTRSWYEQNMGVFGAHVVQVGHGDQELVIDTSGATGYLGTTVTS